MTYFNQTDWIRIAFTEIRTIWQTNNLDPSYQTQFEEILTNFEELICHQSSEQQALFVLPYLCSFASDGSEGCSSSITAAWLSYYYSAHLLDLIEDHNELPPFLINKPPGVVINLATGFLITAQQILSHLHIETVNPQGTSDILRYFSSKLQIICSGQHQDLIGEVDNLNRAWRIAEAKSGEFFALACLTGARSVTQDRCQLEGFESFGFHLGTIIQIRDDLHDLNEDLIAKSELSQKKRGLPVMYALQVLSPNQSTLLKNLLESAPYDEQSRAIAYEIIIECGAVVYLKLEATKRSLIAQQSLLDCSSSSIYQTYLLDLIKQVESTIQK